jgi:hypothetical protein
MEIIETLRQLVEAVEFAYDKRDLGDDDLAVAIDAATDKLREYGYCRDGITGETWVRRTRGNPPRI